MNNKLIHSDSTDKSILPNDCIDLIVTSPPYNVGQGYTGNKQDDLLEYKEYLEFTEKWLSNCYYWTATTGRLCLNTFINRGQYEGTMLDMVNIAKSVGWKYNTVIIWNKYKYTKFSARGSWYSASAPYFVSPIEAIIVLYKDEWKRKRQKENDITSEEFKEYSVSLWNVNGETKKINHECPFPREIPKRCIKLLSFVGDTVLDPFVGSGTTMIESVENNRVAIGIEKQSKYCDVTIDRILGESNLIFENKYIDFINKEGTTRIPEWKHKK